MIIKKRGTSCADDNLQRYMCVDLIGPGERVDPFTKFAPSSWWIGWLGTLLVNGLTCVQRATRWPAG